MNNDLISRDDLIDVILNDRKLDGVNANWEVNRILVHIKNAPTICGNNPKCKTCKYYHPYYEQFTNKPRGDGYCAIERMTPEGITTINCNDDFNCSDYQKGG